VTITALNRLIAKRTASAVDEAREQLANGWTDEEVLEVARDAWRIIEDLKEQRDARLALGLLEPIREQLWGTACRQASPQHWTMRCYREAGHAGDHLYTVKTEGRAA
jgi:hypothetical protein